MDFQRYPSTSLPDLLITCSASLPPQALLAGSSVALVTSRSSSSLSGEGAGLSLPAHHPVSPDSCCLSVLLSRPSTQDTHRPSRWGCGSSSRRRLPVSLLFTECAYRLNYLAIGFLLYILYIAGKYFNYLHWTHDCVLWEVWWMEVHVICGYKIKRHPPSSQWSSTCTGSRAGSEVYCSGRFSYSQQTHCL